MLSLALSWAAVDAPQMTIRKVVVSTSVDVSFGSRLPKRMIPSSERHAPVTMTSPRTKAPLARIEPSSENWATTTSPAESANSTMKNSGGSRAWTGARP